MQTFVYCFKVLYYLCRAKPTSRLQPSSAGVLQFWAPAPDTHDAAYWMKWPLIRVSSLLAFIGHRIGLVLQSDRLDVCKKWYYEGHCYNQFIRIQYILQWIAHTKCPNCYLSFQNISSRSWTDKKGHTTNVGSEYPQRWSNSFKSGSGFDPSLPIWKERNVSQSCWNIARDS